jgi:hypothetical protein
MTTVAEQIERLRRTADDLATALKGTPEAIVAKRPAEKAWAAKEVVCHLRDVEELWLNRFQTILANDEPKLLPVDPDAWALDRQYLRNDVGEALSSFGHRRRETLDFLTALKPEQWERAGLHSSRGRLTLRDFVGVMAWHDDNHLDQLKRALDGKP